MKWGSQQHSTGSDKAICIVALVVLLMVCYRMGQLASPHPPLTDPLQGSFGQSKVSNATSEPWIETLSWKPRAWVYHNILTAEECDHIVAIGAGEVTRSQVVSGAGSTVSDVRTSYGVFMTKFTTDPILRKLEKKISDWTHLPEVNGESFYLLRYEKGQQYKAHNDYFQSQSDMIGRSGNRIATVLTYLSTPDEGGETHFPMANIKVKAVKGNAVLFWDVTPDGREDPLSLHAGLPVITGTKWAMTKWIRERPFSK